MNDKPGWKTTEFWATTIAQVLSGLALFGFVTPNDSQTLEEASNKIVAAVFLFVSNAAIVIYYVKSRLHIKTGIGNQTGPIINKLPLKMEKLLAMYVAAQLTEAACDNVGSNLNVSQDLSDPQVRAKNLQVWETFRVFYAAVVGALADTTSWPVPNIPADNLLPNLVQSLTPLVSGSGPLAGIAGKVLALLTTATAPKQASAKPLPANIPNPGATVTNTTSATTTTP